MHFRPTLIGDLSPHLRTNICLLFSHGLLGQTLLFAILAYWFFLQHQVYFFPGCQTLLHLQASLLAYTLLMYSVIFLTP